MYFDPLSDFQAKAPEPVAINETAFLDIDQTEIYWMTSAGVLMNRRGTTIMIDPILSLRSYDLHISEVREYARDIIPQYVMPPISANEVKNLDAVLITHADPDHLGFITVNELLSTGTVYFGTNFTVQKLIEYGVPENRIRECRQREMFSIDDVRVEVTVTNHPVPLYRNGKQYYTYKKEDCCGYKLYTPDGVIWNPGDTILLDEHFNNEDVDLLLMDFSEEYEWHFGQKNALQLANHLIESDIIMIHWGTFFSPDFSFFSANPDGVRELIDNKERFIEPHPGEKVILRNKHMV